MKLIKQMPLLQREHLVDGNENVHNNLYIYIESKSIDVNFRIIIIYYYSIYLNQNLSMDSYQPYMPFSQRVESAISSGDFDNIVIHLV